MKLNVKAFALASGLVWGINWFGVTWWMMAFDGATREVLFVGRMYRGFTLSPIGSLVALLWGFGDGFLIGLMVAWIYNKVSPHFQSDKE